MNEDNQNNVPKLLTGVLDCVHYSHRSGTVPLVGQLFMSVSE